MNYKQYLREQLNHYVSCMHAEGFIIASRPKINNQVENIFPTRDDTLVVVEPNNDHASDNKRATGSASRKTSRKARKSGLEKGGKRNRVPHSMKTAYSSVWYDQELSTFPLHILSIDNNRLLSNHYSPDDFEKRNDAMKVLFHLSNIAKLEDQVALSAASCLENYLAYERSNFQFQITLSVPLTCLAHASKIYGTTPLSVMLQRLERANCSGYISSTIEFCLMTHITVPDLLTNAYLRLPALLESGKSISEIAPIIKLMDELGLTNQVVSTIGKTVTILHISGLTLCLPPSIWMLLLVMNEFDCWYKALEGAWNSKDKVIINTVKQTIAIRMKQLISAAFNKSVDEDQSFGFEPSTSSVNFQYVYELCCEIMESDIEGVKMILATSLFHHPLGWRSISHLSITASSLFSKLQDYYMIETCVYTGTGRNSEPHGFSCARDMNLNEIGIFKPVIRDLLHDIKKTLYS